MNPEELAQRLWALGAIDFETRPLIHAAGLEFSVRFADGRRLQVAAADPEVAVRAIEKAVARATPPVEAVRLRGKVLGFRSWKLSGHQLLSANQEFGAWAIGEPTKASCVAAQYLPREYLHDAPQAWCHCGLYALHEPEFMSRWHGNDPFMVHGAVLGWGRMEVHAEGWRAEYAQPVMLAVDPERQTLSHCQRILALGAELGLPVAEWPEFEPEARKLGEPVPQNLRPLAPAIPAFQFASVRGNKLGFATGGVIQPGGTVILPGPTPPQPSRRTRRAQKAALVLNPLGVGVNAVAFFALRPNPVSAGAAFFSLLGTIHVWRQWWKRRQA